MREDDRIRIRHMIDAARDALSFIAAREREDLDTDRMLALALVRSIEIVGEAGAMISPQGRAQIPNVPWREIVAMRNRLIHAYFDVNLDVVWETVRNDLPPLISVLETALQADER